MSAITVSGNASFASFVTILLFLGGCATSATLPIEDSRVPAGVSKSVTVRSEFTASEQDAYGRTADRLKTKAHYHEVVLNPAALIDKLEGGQRFPALDVIAPIYLLGVEKPQSRHAVPKHSCKTGDFLFADLERASPQGRSAACKTLDDLRMQVLTHVVRFDGIASGVYQRPCFLYNVYNSATSCADATPSTVNNGSDLYVDGVRAVDSLQSDLQRRLTGITHIIVLSTGWNTHQDESLYNYLEWMAILQSQAPSGMVFHPLYLVVTWQSKWDFSVGRVSVANKGNDADEVGLRWASRLVNNVVQPLASVNKIPVVLVGHSYGTRILGSAVYRRDADRNTTGSMASPLAFLALQPAFTLNRFDKGKESTFATRVPPTTLVAMTASENDEAGKVTSVAGIPYALSGLGIRKITAGDFPLITLGNIDNAGHIDGSLLHRPGLYLLNASRIVNDHNDVYDKEVGTLFWDVLKSAQDRAN